MENNIFEIIKEEVEKIKEEIINWRRFFHQYPELGFEEYKTSEKIQSLLKEFGIPFEVKAKTGVVGFLKGKKSDITVGIRADMDALPIQEETGLPFSSKNPGIMHACGHDGHMAAALGVAKILSGLKNKLKGNVKFIFQPCEEKFPGGALKMIEEGSIEDVNYLIGFHFFSFLPLYHIWIGKGAIMANTDEFKIIIRGKGGHASSPHLTNDPICCASYFITQIQTIISRKIDPFQPAVISVGKIKGGETFNVIPEIVEIEGTVRTLSDGVRMVVKEEMEKTLKNICSNFNCKYELNYRLYCPSLINDVSFSERVKEISEKIIEKENIAEYHPILGGEDFAFFSRKIPSCYIFIGIGEECGPNHNSKFTINENILPYATFYLSSLLFSILNGI
ncbi:MAG: amidohydrolase [Candidatus Omnitrophota bacterium]|nr:MAG: amidohydrolase [Candidatus Omnitrophota bacterium]